MCPVCGSSQSKIWGFRAIPILQCLSCQVTFFPREGLETEDYTDYGQPHLIPGYSIEYDLNLRRPKYRKQLKRISRYTQGRKLLDIGAAGGGFCVIAKKFGWDVYGIEVSAKARAVGESQGVQYIENGEDGSFDVITCFHILEHIPEPNSFLANIHRMLKPGGVLVVHVPHQEPLSFAIRNRLFPVKDTYCQLYSPEHLTGFTIPSLAKTLELSGFDSLRVTTRSMWSCYYDPFFLKLYLAKGDYKGIVKHTLRCVVDTLGIAVDKGDWVIGHFRKPSSTRHNVLK